MTDAADKLKDLTLPPFAHRVDLFRKEDGSATATIHYTALPTPDAAAAGMQPLAWQQTHTLSTKTLDGIVESIVAESTKSDDAARPAAFKTDLVE